MEQSVKQVLRVTLTTNSPLVETLREATKITSSWQLTHVSKFARLRTDFSKSLPDRINSTTVPVEPDESQHYLRLVATAQ